MNRALKTGLLYTMFFSCIAGFAGGVISSTIEKYPKIPENLKKFYDLEDQLQETRKHSWDVDSFNDKAQRDSLFSRVDSLKKEQKITLEGKMSEYLDHEERRETHRNYEWGLAGGSLFLAAMCIPFAYRLEKEIKENPD
jgi:hypothetical protein